MRLLPSTMTHIHGTPIGGARQDVARALIGRHALVPYPRPDDMEIVAEVCQSFVLDNGAFSVWKRGETLDVEGYTKWVREWHRHPGFDWALIPDVIEGSEEDNDVLLDEWPGDLPGVPVWHMHESIGRLIRLASDYPAVALGSSGAWPTPGAATWWVRMGQAMDALCDEYGRPPCRLHGLRMLNPDIFTRLPLASADSANAGINNNRAHSYYSPPTKAQRTAVIMDRIEVHNSAATWTRIDQNELFENAA